MADSDETLELLANFGAMGERGSEGGIKGAAGLLAAALEMLNASVQKLNEEKRESEKLSRTLADADAATTKSVDAQREALDRASVARAEYFHNYLRNTRDAVEAEAKLQEARMKASFENSDHEDSTRKRIADRAVDDMEQAGILSHAAALKAKEQLDLEYEARKLERERKQDIAEEGEVARQQANKEIALGMDTAKENQSEKTYEGAVQAKAANEQKIKEAQARMTAGEDLKKSLRERGIDDESVERLQEWTRKHGGDDSADLPDQYTAVARENLKNIALVGPLAAKFLPAGQLVSQFGPYGDQNLATYQGAMIDIAAGKSDLARYQKKQVGLDIAEGNAKSDLDFARQRMEKDRDSVQDLGDKLASMSATNRIKEAGARADFALEAAAHMLEGHATNVNNFMSQVNRLANSMGNMSPQAIADLTRRVDEIQAAQGNSRNWQSG